MASCGSVELGDVRHGGVRLCLARRDASWSGRVRSGEALRGGFWSG